MPLPIIIILERHWDKLPKQVLSYSLSSLQKLGYNTLCFESPKDIPEAETIANLEHTIKFIEERLMEAHKLLSKQGIITDLLALEYTELEQLLLNFVTSRHSHEMALWFKELPGHKEKFNLVQKARKLNFQIRGADLPTKQLDKINSLESQKNLKTRISGIDELEDMRISGFKETLLNLQQQANGVIFVVGQSHYKGLVEKFAKDHLLNEILFIHPYILECLIYKNIDYQLDIPNIQNINLIEAAFVRNNIENDIEIFSNSINNTIQSMLSKSIAVEPTSTCVLLNSKTNLNFKAYVSPSYLVDCHHFFSDKESLSEALKKLNQEQVYGFFTQFNNQKSYCVPNINRSEVANKIRNMK